MIADIVVRVPCWDNLTFPSIGAVRGEKGGVAVMFVKGQGDEQTSVSQRAGPPPF